MFEEVASLGDFVEFDAEGLQLDEHVLGVDDLLLDHGADEHTDQTDQPVLLVLVLLVLLTLLDAVADEERQEFFWQVYRVS